MQHHPTSSPDLDKLQERVPSMPTGIDGMFRSPKKEEELNEAVYECMKGGYGKEMLTWLKSITLNHVLRSDATAQQLAYQEGMRYVVALLQLRVTAHEAKLKGVK